MYRFRGYLPYLAAISMPHTGRARRRLPFAFMARRTASAARRIRALPREDARRVPILAMSANAYQEDKEMSMEAGMNAHIAKPFDKDETLRLAAGFALRYRHP